MKTCIKIMFLVFVSLSAGAKQSVSDSLKRRFQHAANDSLRFHLLIQLGSVYQEIHRDSAVLYFDKALTIARKNNHVLGVASALDGKGYALIHMGRLAQSLQCFLEAIKLAEDPENEFKTFYQKDKQKARENRLLILANIHHDWGHLMGKINVDEQIYHYRQTEAIAKELKDTNMLGFVNMNLGHVYMEKRRYDTALVMEKNAERMFTQTKDMRYLGVVYSLMGEIYFNQNEKQKGLAYLQKAIFIASNENNLATVNYSYLMLSRYFLEEKNIDSCLYYAKKAISGFKAMQSGNLAEGYSLMYKVFRLVHNKDSIIKYQELALIATDSANNKNLVNITALQKSLFAEQQRLQILEQEKLEFDYRMRNFGMLGILGILVIGGLLLFRNIRQEQKAKLKIEKAYADLKSTQAQLIQSEKMASLGELTAGIAHEIQNPLNFVNNFSEVSNELLAEMKEELEKGNLDEVKEITNDVQQNLDKILHHGKRADAIVKGMLQHSRSSSGKKEPTDINALADEYLRLAYHGLRAKDKSFNAKMETHFDESIGKIDVIPQDFGRVILNLITNAFYVVDEKKRRINLEGFQNLQGLKAYEPTVSVSTKKLDDKIEIKVKDNGNGIPPNILDKIFQPFFTTKPTGQGTGLGLSLSYDIVKAHGGDLKVETKEGEGSVFIIQLSVV